MQIHINQLLVDSDAAYLVLLKARSRIAGYFRLANTPTSPYKYRDNGAILIECHTLRDVVTSAAEAETTFFFKKCKNYTSYPQHSNCYGTSSAFDTNCN